MKVNYPTNNKNTQMDFFDNFHNIENFIQVDHIEKIMKCRLNFSLCRSQKSMEARKIFQLTKIYAYRICGHQTVCRGTLVCREKFEMCREIILRKSNFEVFPKICRIFSYKSCLILFVIQISH
jgi:hypothetical protein